MAAGSGAKRGLRWPAALALAAGFAVLAVGVWVGLGFLEGDTDRYGRVPVPATTAVALDPGEVDLFYAEDVSLGEGENLAVPGDLRLRISGPDGQPLELRPRSGQEVSGSGGTAALIGLVDVPAEGAYEVATRSSAAAGRPDPEVTLGESPFDAIGDRVGEVADVLLGPLGIGAIGLALLLAIVAWARRRSTLEGPTLPGGGA